jgi:ABC-type dipeptide/oligopeptide/nickel transport system permease subunit
MAAVTTIVRPDLEPRPGRRWHALTGSSRLWWLGLAPVAVLAVVALIGPWITPYAPTRVVGPTSVAPDGRFWFGTDSNGLDVFSRVLAATRVNMEIATAVVLLATAGGIALGLLVGMNESRRGLLGVLARGLARLIDLVQAVPAVLIGSWSPSTAVTCPPSSPPSRSCCCPSRCGWSGSRYCGCAARRSSTRPGWPACRSSG